MALLDGLLWKRRAEAVAAALTAIDGTVVVVRATPLARALGASRRILTVAERESALRRVGGQRLLGGPRELPLAGGCCAALVGFAGDLPGDEQLAEWIRPLRPGGLLVLLSRAPAEDAAGAALAAGLVNIEQRSAGRWVVTSGRAPREP